MKIRSGFVSNSSTSSFLINFSNEDMISSPENIILYFFNNKKEAHTSYGKYKNSTFSLAHSFYKQIKNSLLDQDEIEEIKNRSDSTFFSKTMEIKSYFQLADEERNKISEDEYLEKVFFPASQECVRKFFDRHNGKNVYLVELDNGSIFEENIFKKMKDKVDCLIDVFS